MCDKSLPSLRAPLPSFQPYIYMGIVGYFGCVYILIGFVRTSNREMCSFLV